jgi:hypothetical protein
MQADRDRLAKFLFGDLTPADQTAVVDALDLVRTWPPFVSCPRTQSARRCRPVRPVLCLSSPAGPAGARALPPGELPQFTRSRGRSACARPLTPRCG